MVDASLGAMSSREEPFAGWTEFFIIMTGMIFSLEVCCRLIAPMLQITPPWCFLWMLTSSLIEDLGLKFFGLADLTFLNRFWSLGMLPHLTGTPLLTLRYAVVNEIIFKLDVVMENRELTQEEHRFRKAMKVKVLGLASLERCMWRQRSRILWLKEGDCNSKFFHVKASARRRKSFIQSITVGDVTTIDQQN
jgi:hypothetical protein